MTIMNQSNWKFAVAIAAIAAIAAVFLFTSSAPPSNDLPTTSSLKEKETPRTGTKGEAQQQQQALLQPTTVVVSHDEQTCPAGLWNNDTHLLEVNPDCPQSEELLNMPRVEVKEQKKLTYFLLYYNNHRQLAQHVMNWKNFSQATLDQIQFLIVDDGSTIGHRASDLFAANRDLIQQPGLLDIVVYNIDQDLTWNIGGARNLGFWMANTEWVFMNDCDIAVKHDTMDFIADLVHRDYSSEKYAPVYIYFKRSTPGGGLKVHPAVQLIKREYYWILGGCDEDFVGHYGQTDPHFREKLQVHKELKAKVTEPLMNQQNISPLLQMIDDPPCPEGMKCLEPYVGEKASKDTTHNHILFQKKKKVGVYSNECLRFTWKRDKSWEENPSSSRLGRFG